MSQSASPSIIPYASPYGYPPTSPYEHSFTTYTPAPTQPLVTSYNRYGESQVNHVYEPVLRQPQPQPSPINPVPAATSTKIQRVGLTSIQESHEQEGGLSRYQQYLTVGAERKYKYNVFSVVDEPWNRCLEGRGCGTLPASECVAGETFRREWQ